LFKRSEKLIVVVLTETADKLDNVTVYYLNQAMFVNDLSGPAFVDDDIKMRSFKESAQSFINQTMNFPHEFSVNAGKFLSLFEI
jgi:hypothetical protein